MDPNIIIALITGVTALVGSLGGAFLSNRLQQYRLEQLEKKVEIVPELEKETQNLHSEIEKESQNLYNEIEKETQAIQSELDSFVNTAGERRKMVENIQDDVEQLKNDVNGINTRIALLENEVKLFKQNLHKDG